MTGVLTAAGPDDAACETLRAWLRTDPRRREALRGTFHAVAAADHPPGDPLHPTPRLDAPLAVLDSLLLAVDLGPGGRDQACDTWHRLGARLAAEGIPAASYQPLAQSLVRSVRHVAGDTWSTWLSSAWIAYHLWMTTELARGAEGIVAVRPQPARHVPPPADPLGPPPGVTAVPGVPGVPDRQAPAGPVTGAVGGHARRAGRRGNRFVNWLRRIR